MNPNERACLPRIQEEIARQSMDFHLAKVMDNWRRNIFQQSAAPETQLRKV